MPNYDYVCDKCGSTKEVFHGSNETPEIICDEKGCKTKMRKGFWNAPYLNPAAVPTRKNNSGVSPALRKSKQH